MTIKEFARLCFCNAQTLRYYDKIGLLKPNKVDPWSGYRYYEPSQAVDFVKIKNLQAADFSIQEIKGLLSQSDQQIYAAFDAKIAEQEHKLVRIREIQQAYLAEKNTMEQIIYSMTDYLLSQCNHPEVLQEFGLSTEDAPAILAHLRRYLNRNILAGTPDAEVSMTINDEVIQGQEAVLNRIHSLTRDNLTDTILINQGPGHETTTTDPDFSDWEITWEQYGWHHLHGFWNFLPPLEQGKQYCLWVQTQNQAPSEDLSFPLFLLGTLLCKRQLEDIPVNCCVSVVADKEQHMKLLCKAI